jgi:hypothetical protein
MKAPRRLHSDTLDMRLPLASGHHDLTVSLIYDARERLTEIAFVGRGKIGGALDQILVELGIRLSRAIQGRDPDTGAVVQ